MGLISTIANSIRNKKVPRRLSSQSTKLPDDDSKDLIKPYSETTSLRAESIASTSTMVHHSVHEPVLPSDSPANKLANRTENLNKRTLFDTSSHSTPISPTSPMDHRAARALSGNEYPIFKLDMCQAEFRPRRLEGPLETGYRGRVSDTTDVGEIGGGGDSMSESLTDVEKDVVVSPGKDENDKMKEKKARRSMKGLLKKHCGLNIPRSSLSLKTKSPASASPKWLDSTGLGDDGDEGFIDVKNEKWLEAHLGLRGRRRNGAWGGTAMGRPL
jgi:hypothetical protein